ncbi:MAG: ribosome small subunit-dependent GTPase A, partial [Bryobacteraceae bacterium]
MSLFKWGWSDYWAGAAREGAGWEPARVIAVHRERYILAGESGEFAAELSGRLEYTSGSAAELPVVGDWVLAALGILHRVLPRRTLIARRAAGGVQERQPLAANIDVVFIVSGLDGDFNPRRLERYLVLAIESGARPVFVLNKADLCAAPEEALRDVSAVAAGHPVVLTSAERNEGVTAMLEWLPPGATGALVGSSGAGKSSLTNRLAGMSVQPVREVRESDSRGRHTTTHRQLFPLPGGGLLIDQPGLREIQVWAARDSLDDAFPDVSGFACQCRFRDCRHEKEPDCAVQAAIEARALEAGRLK